MAIGHLGEAADDLASALHKALALGAVINRDHRSGYESPDDLALVERALHDLDEAVVKFTNLLWSIGHGATEETEHG